MPDQLMITCPKCGEQIALTEAFTHEIEEKQRRSFEQTRQKQEEEFRRKLAAQEKEHESAVQTMKKEAEMKARRAAEEELSEKLADLTAQEEENRKKLHEARQKEIEFLKRQRESEEREAGMKVELERRLTEERRTIREELSRKTDEEFKFREREKDHQLEEMRKQIEDLRRKADQGSQQAQGEALELELEERLRVTFPLDTIEPVAKGVKGADVLQKVMNKNVQQCGAILWETKRTKAWSDGWLQKLKDDQRTAKAEIAVLISTVLPRDIQHIGCTEGVWVTDFSSAMGLAIALRNNLLDLAQVRNSLANRSEKMDLMYDYLLGPEFKARVEAIAEAFVAMKDDLDAEKRAMEKSWAKREKLIQKIMHNTAGMHGDLEGILGKTLPQINHLELKE